MDTVRQDHLSCYGYSRQTTPVLNELTKTSRLYMNAYSVSSWTNPAHASLFTGLYPRVHNTTQESWAMPQQVTTLAEILTANGYETVGIAENAMLSKTFNFDQGFLNYYEGWKSKWKNENENVAFSLFNKFLMFRDKRKPYFAFINFIGPHAPYNTSRQFIKTFINGDNIPKLVDNKWKEFFLGKKIFSPEELRDLTALYDAEILYVDFIIGKIIKKLKKSELWDNTIFIIASDHGENIGDHEMVNHVFSLYETTTKIPLIIHYPKLFAENSKDFQPTQLVDLFPTLLKITGLGRYGNSSQGRDLLDENARNKRPVFCEYYYPIQALSPFRKKDRDSPKLEKYKRHLSSLIIDNIKLVLGSDNNNELYDLSIDPQEENNLINSNAYAETKQNMQQELERLLNDLKSQGSFQKGERKGGIDGDTIDSLKSLGYL